MTHEIDVQNLKTRNFTKLVQLHRQFSTQPTRVGLQRTKSSGLSFPPKVNLLLPRRELN